MSTEVIPFSNTKHGIGAMADYLCSFLPNHKIIKYKLDAVSTEMATLELHIQNRITKEVVLDVMSIPVRAKVLEQHIVINTIEISTKAPRTLMKKYTK